MPYSGPPISAFQKEIRGRATTLQVCACVCVAVGLGGGCGLHLR